MPCVHVWGITSYEVVRVVCRANGGIAAGGELDRAKGDSGELVSVRVTVAVMLIGQYRSAKIRRDDAAGKTMGETVRW